MRNLSIIFIFVLLFIPKMVFASDPVLGYGFDLSDYPNDIQNDIYSLKMVSSNDVLILKVNNKEYYSERVDGDISIYSFFVNGNSYIFKFNQQTADGNLEKTSNYAIMHQSKFQIVQDVESYRYDLFVYPDNTSTYYVLKGSTGNFNFGKININYSGTTGVKNYSFIVGYDIYFNKINNQLVVNGKTYDILNGSEYKQIFVDYKV